MADKDFRLTRKNVDRLWAEKAQGGALGSSLVVVQQDHDPEYDSIFIIKAIAVDVVPPVYPTPPQVSGLATIDGVSLIEGDIMLRAYPFGSPANGLWRVSAGAWTRYRESAHIDGLIVNILQGLTYRDRNFKLATDTQIIFGTTAIDFQQNEHIDDCEFNNPGVPFPLVVAGAPGGPTFIPITSALVPPMYFINTGGGIIQSKFTGSVRVLISIKLGANTGGQWLDSAAPPPVAAGWPVCAVALERDNLSGGTTWVPAGHVDIIHDDCLGDAREKIFPGHTVVHARETEQFRFVLNPVGNAPWTATVSDVWTCWNISRRW